MQRHTETISNDFVLILDSQTNTTEIFFHSREKEIRSIPIRSDSVSNRVYVNDLPSLSLPPSIVGDVDDTATLDEDFRAFLHVSHALRGLNPSPQRYREPFSTLPFLHAPLTGHERCISPPGLVLSINSGTSSFPFPCVRDGKERRRVSMGAWSPRKYIIAGTAYNRTFLGKKNIFPFLLTSPLSLPLAYPSSIELNRDLSRIE